MRFVVASAGVQATAHCDVGTRRPSGSSSGGSDQANHLQTSEIADVRSVLQSRSGRDGKVRLRPLPSGKGPDWRGWLPISMILSILGRAVRTRQAPAALRSRGSRRPRARHTPASLDLRTGDGRNRDDPRARHGTGLGTEAVRPQAASSSPRAELAGASCQPDRRIGAATYSGRSRKTLTGSC